MASRKASAPEKKAARFKKRIVLFLGAGASAPFGYPTTEAILPAILRAIAPGQKPADLPAWFKRAKRRAPQLAAVLTKGLQKVLPGSTGSKLSGAASIIDVLSTLDYLIASKQSLAPEFNESELREMRRLLDLCINGTLRGSKRKKIREDLVNWIARKTSKRARVAIVTTNYDCMFDWPLFKAIAARNKRRHLFEQVDFGTSVLSPQSVEFNRPMRAKVAVLKLHGSLNSLRCEVCGHLYVNPATRIVSLEFRKKLDRYNTCICQGRLRSILVAPSLVRDVREPHLLAIWNAALNELRLADEWIFVGYSLPQEDIAIRALLLRALHGRVRKKLKVMLALRDPVEMRDRRRKELEKLSPEKRAAEIEKEEKAKANEERTFQLKAKRAKSKAAKAKVRLERARLRAEKLEQPLREARSDATLKRYMDFVPKKHFRKDEEHYFPDGITQLTEALITR